MLVESEPARTFWTASLAWRRFPGYYEGVTVDRLFKWLGPLEHHPRMHALSRQAELLSMQIVHNNIRRKRDGTAKILPLTSRTKVSGQEIKAA